MEGCDQIKAFVGGISSETTEEVLREHFGEYGKVVGVVIVKDRTTGFSRGFAFVSFSEESALNLVLLDSHTILGRTVDVKKAVPRSEQTQKQQEQNWVTNCTANGINSNINLKVKKIFVGGLPANITEDEFRVYFENFGRINDVVVMQDNVTRRSRGFGFITFDSEGSVDEVMQKTFHELCGKLVEVKRAVPKENGVAVGIGLSSNSPCRRPSQLSGGNSVLPIYGGFFGGYPYGSGVYGGAYYGGINYGLAPFSFGAPWGVLYPVTVYPTYMNNVHASTSMATTNGYNGMMGFELNRRLSQLSGGNGHRADAVSS